MATIDCDTSHWNLHSGSCTDAITRVRHGVHRVAARIGVCASLLLLGFAPAAFSASGDLDPTFAGVGYALVDGGASTLSAEGLLLQLNGRVVAAATANDGVSNRPMLARRKSNGSPDTSFGIGGTVYPAIFGADYLGAADLVQDLAGRILMVGLGSDHVYVYRFLANGALDTSFNGTGMVTLDAPGVFSPVCGITQDLFGRIIISANSTNPVTNHVDFLVARLHTNGTLDPTFGGTGVVHTALSGTTGVDLARAPVVQWDGRIVVGGRSRASSADPYQFALVRYENNGTLDPSFGTGGIVTFAMASGDSFGRRLLLQLDGRLIIAGTVCDPADDPLGELCRAGVARLKSNGTLDASFGTGGRAYATLGPWGGFTFDVAQDWLGRIVVAGTAFTSADQDVPSAAMAARFKFNGALDNSFGLNGVSLTTWGFPMTSSGNVAIGLDLNIYLSGSASNTDDLSTPTFLGIARLQR